MGLACTRRKGPDMADRLNGAEVGNTIIEYSISCSRAVEEI